MNTVVLIPTYNEVDNLRALVERIIAAGENIGALIIDDGSPDGTGDLAERLATEYPGRIDVIHRTMKSGRGDAVATGLEAALDDRTIEFVVELDGDLSHPPEDIPAMIVRARAGANVVVASRYIEGGKIIGWSRGRHVWSGVANRLADIILNLGMSDYTNGFRLYDRKAAETLLGADLQEKGYIALSESAFVLHRAGMVFGDVPSVFTNRVAGETKMSLAEAVGGIRGLARLRWRAMTAR
jgi:dolichol-phosphate mannosyltransferase